MEGLEQDMNLKYSNIAVARKKTPQILQICIEDLERFFYLWDFSRVFLGNNIKKAAFFHF